MSQTTLLECREATAAQNHANGDWQTVLNAPQMLMPGDQVILKTAALDTRKATTGTVTLENDVSGTISGYPYVVNYLPDGKSYISGNVTEGDFQRYFAAKLHTNPNHNTYKIINSLKLTRKRAGFNIPKSSFRMNYLLPSKPVMNTILKATAPGSTYTLNSTNDITAALAVSLGHVFIKSTKDEPSAAFTFYGTNSSGTSVTIAAGNVKANIPFFLQSTFTTITGFEVTGGNPQPLQAAGTITVGTMGAPKVGFTNISVPKTDTTAGGGNTTVTFNNLNIVVNSSVEVNTITFDNFSGNALAKTPPYAPIYNIVPALSPDGISHSYFEPLLLAHDFTIPAGTYEPDALCSVINSSITLNKLQGGSSTALVLNDMLKNSKYLGAGETLFMVRESNSTGETPHAEAFTFDQDKSFWIGCSTMQLGVNTNTNCFEWQYLHTPYYDSQTDADAGIAIGSGNPAVLFEENASNVYFAASAMMGIALNSMTPSTFWESQLGFDAISTAVTNSGPFSVGNVNSTFFPTYTAIIQGNTTAQFVGTDSVVQKKKLPFEVPEFLPNPHANGRKQFVSTANLDNFLPVKAPIAYTTLAKDTTGYFLLDVQTNFRTETVGSTDTSRTIQAIVGRFYNTGSFTIAGSDSGIVYQHVGAPQMIQSLSIRILHPDGTLADDVGNDSTLYFEIQRQIK